MTSPNMKTQYQLKVITDKIVQSEGEGGLGAAVIRAYLHLSNPVEHNIA